MIIEWVDAKGVYNVLDTVPLSMGPPPEWWQPHRAEPEVVHYLNGNEDVTAVRPCWCPCPADHPVHQEVTA